MREQVAAVLVPQLVFTDLLHDDGWTAIIVAVVALVGIWLSGPDPRPGAARRALTGTDLDR